MNKTLSFPRRGKQRHYRFFFAKNIYLHTYLRTYHSRFVREGIAEVSQIFLRKTHVLPKLVSYGDTANVKGGKPIAVLL
jgi:hypothetical protein